MTRQYRRTALTAGRYTVAAVRHRHGYTVINDSGRIVTTSQDPDGRPVPAIWPTIRAAAVIMRELARQRP